MSVLLELSIFPLDKGESLSAFIAPVMDLIRSSGFPYQLTAMGTLVETEALGEALALVWSDPMPCCRSRAASGSMPR